jgi:hypothetical protein
MTLLVLTRRSSYEWEKEIRAKQIINIIVRAQIYYLGRSLDTLQMEAASKARDELSTIEQDLNF